MNTHICPICGQTFNVAAADTKHHYCSAACTEQAMLQLECWQYVITLRPLLPAEFLAMLQQRSLRDYARQMVWQQGGQEFMVCEDYTLANIHSAQITLTPKRLINFIPVPSAAWQEVLWEYEMIGLAVENGVDSQKVQKLTNSWLLDKLIYRAEIWLQVVIAANPYTPHPVLEVLLNASQGTMEQWLEKNTNWKYEGIISYAPRSYIPLRVALASNPSNTAACLGVLALDEDAFTRRTVAANPNTDQATLVLLAEDANQLVRKVARQRLEAR